MSFYRVFPLLADGRYGVAEDVYCSDDAAAIRLAVSIDRCAPRGCDIWELKRFVGRIAWDGPERRPFRSAPVVHLGAAERPQAGR